VLDPTTPNETRAALKLTREEKLGKLSSLLK